MFLSDTFAVVSRGHVQRRNGQPQPSSRACSGTRIQPKSHNRGLNGDSGTCEVYIADHGEAFRGRVRTVQRLVGIAVQLTLEQWRNSEPQCLL